MHKVGKTRGSVNNRYVDISRSIYLLAVLVCYVVATVTLTSCRKLTELVREERTPCPAWVTITSTPGVEQSVWSYVHLFLPHVEDSFLEERKIRTDEFNGGQVIEWTKNTDFAVVGLAGWSGEIKGLKRTETTLENGLILIPRGRECPLAKGGAVSTALSDEELYSCPMPMRSLFARVKFHFLGETTANGEIAAEVNGWVDGYSVPDFSIHKGEFMCMAHNEGTDKTEVRIPRQEDANVVSYASKLVVSFWYRETVSSSWERITDVSLGNILNKYKYDWSKDDLDDITFKVTRDGRSVSLIEVSSGDWTVNPFIR